VPPLDAAPKKDEKKKKLSLTGLPIFEYQDRGFKWVIENHTKESVIKEASPDGVLTIDISDPKQQVYMYNCDSVGLKITGKFKSLILDKCKKCNVVYDTLISSAEMVNCEKIQIQVNGICPVFTIDKTKNVLVWLSKESVNVSSFTTSLSSEMNVTFPDGDDMKELPIPEQFVHKLGGGLNGGGLNGNGLHLSTDVSDLYH
jgi:adenylyl cyclase-associated protein